MKQPIEHEIAECAAKLAMAEAELDACEHELEHFTIFAPIDGVISWLDVAPGAVVRPGTKTWGEILDLREIDVRCEAPAAQVDLLDPQQPVDIVSSSGSQRFVGRIVTVGLSADRESGTVPVTVRIAGAHERLRLNVEVIARFRLRDSESSRQSTDGDLAGDPAPAP
jgi:multidrug resistance efflux pump